MHVHSEAARFSEVVLAGKELERMRATSVESVLEYVFDHEAKTFSLVRAKGSDFWGLYFGKSARRRHCAVYERG